MFVSSTLRELAAERIAVRAAIERLALTPVMFELGARPHPPRDLYRAYLAQSDIFVGLYAEQYGWVAPGEDVSGLEDEYRLAPDLPKLIYLKQGGRREERLDALLRRIRDDDRASYKAFSTPEELAQLVTADLAVLLAERFDRTREAPAPAEPSTPDPQVNAPSVVAPPIPLTRLIGREKEVDDLVTLLGRDRERLVTLVGPGGIGKSRLALAAADRLTAEFPDGVAFVDLAPVREPARVVEALAQSLGVRDAGDGRLEQRLVTALQGRRVLLLLDNFEQVVDAAAVVVSLLQAVPSIAVLVTSRVLLRVHGERSVTVAPLPLATVHHRGDVTAASAVPSIALFVERARAVKPDFELTEANLPTIASIVAALDGVPLSIELAAARLRVLAPRELEARLGRALAVLVGGSADLPARQRTLRSTIEWSTRILAPAEQRVFARLGVFAGGFSLEAAEWMARDVDGVDPIEALAALVDGSLVRQHDRGDRAFFTMLATVREYAVDQLERDGTLREARDAHASFFLRLARDAELELERADQARWVTRLADDRENLRAAVRHLLDERRWDDVARFAWDLYVYWWVGGQLAAVRAWMQEVLDAGDPLTPRTRAIALYFTRAIAFWQDPDDELIPGFRESADLFRSDGDASGEALALISLALAQLAARHPDVRGADEALHRSLDLFRDAGDGWGEAMSLVTLGRVELVQQRVADALARFDESLAVSRSHHDALGQSIALHDRGWAQFFLGRVDEARVCFEESLQGSAAMGHDEGVAYGLEGLMAIAAASGDAARAGRLLGAAERVREQKGLYNAPSFSFHQQSVDALLAGDSAEVFEASRVEGRAMSVEAALETALAEAPR
ncbi:putative ATPase [Diaminobutyricimonas aerilata]|uniref:Putative ATPase n=1 Tax=Diaminobutyricimonas aerilata TaxID=1162967 RepID=A0A2M9CJR0_9MICO|nr:putative ATPase [Diaminobutyricimonas aerilata]